MDRHSVKTAAEGEARGFHGGKEGQGRSRHVAVDRQGTRLAVPVTGANKAGGSEAAAVMVQVVERHPSIESFTADQSYQRQAEAAARELLGRDLHVTARPVSTAQKRLCAVAFRRRSERTFAWFGQCRLLAKKYEKTIASAEAWLWCAMMRLLVGRLSCSPHRFLVGSVSVWGAHAPRALFSAPSPESSARSVHGTGCGWRGRQPQHARRVRSPNRDTTS